jgi:hypothetical protein
MFLQEFLVLPEGNDIIIMKNDVCELGIELAFSKILVDFLQVGKQGVLFHSKSIYPSANQVSDNDFMVLGFIGYTI